MLTNSIRLFRIGGIDVGVHYSWLVIFGLVTYSLGVGFFPQAIPGLPSAEAWILGAIAAILLFTSVLLHELAHSFMAKARGLDAKSITLFIFGGVSNLAGEAKQPATEFLVAIVGPLMSFVIAGVSYLVATSVTEPRIEATASYLAIINLLLGAFNLIPGFPLDGGRVLRSVVWSITGNLRRATDVAANLGKLVAYGFLAWGFLRLIDGDFLGGAWIALIGWFLHGAASSSLDQVILDTRLRRVRVGDIVRPDTFTVPPGLPVAQLIDEVLLPANKRAVPVQLDGQLIGMVTLSDLVKLTPEQRLTARVEEVMGGRKGVITVRPFDSLAHAIGLLSEHDFEQMPVVEGERLIGMLTRADVMHQLLLREALDV
ncbi:MAG: site-2 protease family protein [Chloroflexota bacterium]|nr:site-2 protease family protein [Chloroflexota bacterium]